MSKDKYKDKDVYNVIRSSGFDELVAKTAHLQKASFIYCDMCNQVCVDKAYKCGTCSNYDLCSGCRLKTRDHFDGEHKFNLVRL